MVASCSMEQIFMCYIVTSEKIIVIRTFMDGMVIHHNLFLLLVKVMMMLWYFYKLCYVDRFHFGGNMYPVVNAEMKEHLNFAIKIY